MNQSSLIRNIHLGIKKTNDLYMGWTGGWWLTAYGVENFMVGNVARFIMEQKDRPAYAFLEVPFGELYDDGGKFPKGPRSEAKKRPEQTRSFLLQPNRENPICPGVQKNVDRRGLQT